MQSQKWYRLVSTSAIIAFAAMVVYLTIEPIDKIMGIAQYFTSETAGSFGHLALFGLFTIALFTGLSHYMHWRKAIILAVVLVLMIGTSTELGQKMVESRTSSVADLFGNWLGAFITGFTVSIIASYFTERNTSQKLSLIPQK